MDTGQAVEHLARAEGRRVRPIKDPEELDELDARLGRRLPAIRVSRRSPGSKTGSAFVAEGLDRDPTHDNAGRLPYLVDFFNRRVLPMVDSEADVVGAYRVELHDSYSYLPGRHLYEEALTFGRAPDAPERRVALLPDPYHMGDFGGIVAAAAADPVPWADKKPTLFFAGTTTGDRDPAKNARIRACVWSLDRRDVAEMHVTKIAQMDPNAILAAHPRFAETLHAPFPTEAHFAYRYQVNVVGNTACWSRLPMILASRSLMVHARAAAPDDAMWYYPLLREGRHYVGADSAEGPDLLKAHAFCRSYDLQCRAMVDEANALARDLFHSGCAAAYAATLLEEAAY